MNRLIPIVGACLLLGGGALVETVQSRPALKDVFKEAFTIGTAVNNVIVSGKDPESRDLVLRHFASITADNAMKAGPINPRPGEFNFGPADAFVAFGEAHGMFIVGHTLVWHNQTPAWFFQDESGKANPPAAQIERMRSHIETGRRYPQITINTAYSFGIDDQEFVVSFEADEPHRFLDLVQELRTSESSAFTLRDTPIFTCVAMSVGKALDALDGTAVTAVAPAAVA